MLILAACVFASQTRRKKNAVLLLWMVRDTQCKPGCSRGLLGSLLFRGNVSPLFLFYKRIQMAGWVYAFVTPSMPGIVKIGATRRNPTERLDEANASDTWRPPRPYVVACTAEVADPFACERALHAFLAARRVGKRHEFFDITVLEARVLLSLLAAPLAPSHIESEREAADDTAAPHLDQAAVASETPESKLRAWVDARYTRVPLREKDSGTKLEVLYAAYTLAAPPVHAKVLGKILFGKMLNAVFPNIGPHRNTTNTVCSIYLVR